MGEHARVESQKIMFHPEWLTRFLTGRHDWRRAKAIYPIQVEISLSGACNHRCTFCAPDFVGYRPVKLSLGVLKKIFSDLSRGGVKSLMFGGEGEPTLNPELAEIITSAKTYGLDVALTTNGSNLNKKLLAKCLKDICWIKVSVDAGRKETYQKIHRPSNPGDFEQIFKNLKSAVELKRRHHYKCRIGAQMLLLPEARSETGEIIPGNINEVIMLAKKLKVLGIDYFIIKPYSHQVLSKTRVYEKVIYKDFSRLEADLKKIAGKNFEIIFRARSMRKNSEARSYNRCLSMPFAWAYIMADGSVYSCSAYLLDKRFYLGNINKQSFKEIWAGERRRRHWQFMKNFDPKNCRKNCLMERVNEYLWESVNPPYNINFI